MPVSLVLTLAPRWSAELSRTTGHLAHGALLAAIADRDPLLAESLHADGGMAKHFCISQLIGPGEPTGPAWPVDAERRYRLRIASLESALSQLLLTMQHDPPPELTLSHLPFQVLGATTHPRRHGWAGRISWDELVGAGVRRAGNRHLRLQFHSPTSFRDGHHNLPLPLPHLVVGSLAAQWRACAPAPLVGFIDALVPAGASQADGAAALERQIRIARHRIETRLLAFPDYRRVGFSGAVDFELAPGIPPAAAAAAQTLACLAQYAGIGDKTTMGMGQVRLSPDDDSRATWI